MNDQKTRSKQKYKKRKTVVLIENNRHPSLKGVANKVRNARRISQLSTKNQKIEPITNVYTIDEPSSSRKPQKFVDLIKYRLDKFFERRRTSIQDLQELREMAKKMPKVEKMRSCCPIPCLQPTYEHDVHKKVTRRHLELETLCCFDSCVIRGGCAAIIVFELLYVLITTLAVVYKFHITKYALWNKLELNFNAIIFHQVFLYAILAFNIVTLFMICALIKSILRFERLYAKLHWQYDFFALAFNCIFLVLFVTALSSMGRESWNIPNIVLIACFTISIPIQLWAISIVKETFCFFNLLYVLISIAE